MIMNAGAKTTALIAALLLASAVVSAAPREPASDDAQQVDNIRAATAANAEKILEKQGGCRILFKVDAGALREAMVTDLRDDVYRILREGRIPFTGLATRDGGVEVRIVEASDRERVRSKLVPSTEATPSREAAVGDSGEGPMRLTPTESGFAARLHGLVRDSMAMIEQRLADSGVGQAGLQPDGADRIRVLLPGVMDPERLTAMFSKRARITFHLLDGSMTAAEALQGTPPPASEVLYDVKDKTPYLLLKKIAMEGDDIIDVAPGFAPQTRQPIASFRFNARGTRYFARITEENVGRPFAIVLDDTVLSMSVIREPILGGSVQISGNFTLKDANTIAMLLRSGTLPGRLSVVEQQVVEPAKQ